MIERDLAAKARDLWSKYPVLTVVAGPRQSGKTTLAKLVFPEAEYLNLELPDIHAMAITVENGGRLDLYEIKSSSTFRPDITANMAKNASITGNAERRAIVYSSPSSGTVGRCEVLDFRPLGQC